MPRCKLNVEAQKILEDARKAYAKEDWYLAKEKIRGRKRNPYLHMICDNMFGGDEPGTKSGWPFAILTRGLGHDFALHNVYAKDECPSTMPKALKMLEAPQYIMALIDIIDSLTKEEE